VDAGREHHKGGRLAVGLYPHISRVKLAELTGHHVSTIAGMLTGRTRMALGDGGENCEGCRYQCGTVERGPEGGEGEVQGKAGTEESKERKGPAMRPTTRPLS